MAGFKSRVIVGAFTLLAHSQFASALTWMESLRLANENNPDLKAARNSTDEANLQTRAAYGGYFPQFSFSTGFTKTEVRSEATTSTPAGVSNSESYNATLNVSENLFNGFGDQARLEQARLNEKILQAALTTAKAKVSQQLKIAFSSVVYSQASITLSDEIIKRRKHNLSLVQLRFEGGRENKGSLLLSQAYLKQAQFDRTLSGNGLTEAKTLLASVVGLEPDAISALEGTVPMSAPPTQVDIKTLAAMTPDIQQALSHEEQSRSGVTIARSSLLPALNFTGSAGKLDSTWFPRGDKWQIGLALTIPLFSGGRDYYALQAAHANLFAATYSRDSVQRGLVTKLQQAYDSFAQSVEKESVDRSFLEAARTRADIARGKYNNGLLSFEEWDIIENDLINREKTALLSGRDRSHSEANWEAALGKGAIP